MNTHGIVRPCWSTAAFGNTADLSPMESVALQAHLDLCRKLHGRLFTLQCAAQTLQQFVAGHFVTSLVLVLVLISASSQAV